MTPLLRKLHRTGRFKGSTAPIRLCSAPGNGERSLDLCYGKYKNYRANVGRDFGAWRDAAAVALQRFGTPQELLLTNDSVLGPFLPLAPLVDAWRAGEMLGHLAALKDTRSKWQLVQRGEIGLTQRMLRAGVPCWALFGQERLAALADAPTRARIAPRYSSAQAFARVPFNPCHHLWRELVKGMGYPYLKTELIRRNPLHVPGVLHWREVVPADELPIIEEHLAMMGP